jgi:dual specificity protein kinase YAK1
MKSASSTTNAYARDYIVEELLGRGTFGQVLLCRDSNGTRVAVKVVKNRKAFQNQAVVEVKILKELNKVEREAPGDSRVVRLLDAFLWRKHLCLVFELL